MQPAVSMMLARVFGFSRGYIMGRAWKLAVTWRGFKTR